MFPEATSAVDTGLSYAEVADTIPGSITEQYGELARKKNCYIVAGIDEREGAAVYNSAVLIDRKGRVAGKYRKVYIPREEIEVGITPGKDYPVFDTDFGLRQAGRPTLRTAMGENRGIRRFRELSGGGRSGPEQRRKP